MRVPCVMPLLLLLLAACAGAEGGRSYAEELFRLLQELRASSNMSSQSSSPAFDRPIHLLRVPKASSSSLSAVARRLVGCDPPGPCCKWPGDPPGSCPSKALFACQTEGKVIGCTHHYANPEALRSRATPSFSMMREPHRRAVSAFFYPGIHHNSKCVGSVDACFQEYASNPRWQNVVVKMLTGAYAYSPDATCARKAECKHSLEEALQNLGLLVFMGVAELWELSLVVLHLTVPRFEPVLAEFKVAELATAAAAVAAAAAAASANSSAPVLPAPSTLAAGASLSGAGQRANHGTSYRQFREQALGQEGAGGKYRKLLERQNTLDTILYARVVERLCAEVHSRGLWQRQVVREYWMDKMGGGNSTAALCSSPRG